MRALVRKELAVTWLSPTPWAIGAAMHVVLGLLFVGELEARGQALAQPLFPLAGFLLLVTVPVLAMRSLAEEARSGSLELLQAVPVASWRLVVGKWLATWFTAVVVLAPAGSAVIVLWLFGRPDMGPIVAGFSGLALLAGALSAIGVLASALSASQPVAALIAFFVGLLLWFAQAGTQTSRSGPLLSRLSLSERLRGFAAGVLDGADAGFFVLLAAAALVLAGATLELRRQR
ncbi:MAG: ABC transporter permease [Acidimicrobiales bacterium]